MNKRISAILISFAMISMIFLNTSLVMASSPVLETNDFYVPGDWVIAGAESYVNETIYVEGNITIPVGASLTLTNVTIMMNCSVANRTHIDVQGTLNMYDGGDGYDPSDAMDADASVIDANVSRYNFWTGPNAVLNIQNSEILNVGNNTNMPPDQWSGVFIRTSMANIDNSRIADGEHGLIFDSCWPASLQNNLVEDNDGIGIGAGDISDPFYNISGVLSNNVVLNNGGPGVYLSGVNVNIEIFGMNVSFNENGIVVMGNGTLNADVHGNEIWRNDGSGYSALYILTNGVLNANIVGNDIIENGCNGVFVGFDHDNGGVDGPSYAKVVVNNNNIYGNNGGCRYTALGDLDITINDNYMGGSDYHSEGGMQQIGYYQENTRCGNLTVTMVGNEFYYGLPTDGWDVPHAIKMGAWDHMDVTFTDNRILHGGIYESRTMLNIGHYFYSEWVFPQTLDAFVSRNEFIVLDDDSTDSYHRTSIQFNAEKEMDIEYTDNYFFSSAKHDYMVAVDEKGHAFHMGNADYCNATVSGNTFVLKPVDDQTYSSGQLGALFYAWANEELNLDFVDNYVENNDAPFLTWDTIPMMMIGGDDQYTDYLTPNVTCNFIDNTVIQNIYGGGEVGVKAIVITSDDQLVCNITGNDITQSRIDDGSGSWADFEGAFKIGSSYGWAYCEDLYLVFNDNTIQGNFHHDADSGGAVRAVANNNITADINNNYIEAVWEDGTADYDYGMRIGYNCNSYGIQNENAVVTSSNNYFKNAGIGSNYVVGANNNLTFTSDGDTMVGAYYGDCGGTGSFTSYTTYGNGLTLMAENSLDATIMNGEFYDNEGAGICIETVGEADVTIENCFIHDNYWHGVYLYDTDGNGDGNFEIADSAIIGNGADWDGNCGAGSGIYAEDVILLLENSTLNNDMNGDYELDLRGFTNATALNSFFDRGDTDIESLTWGSLIGTQWVETNLTLWNTTTDGSFMIDIDGDVKNIDGIDFTGCLDMFNVAGTITMALQAASASPTDGFFSASCTWNTDHFEIESSNGGVLTYVSPLMQSTGTMGTDISGINASAGGFWMSCANGTPMQGTGSWLLNQWFMNVKVQQQGTGMAIPGASITVSDADSNVVYSGMSSWDGYRRWIIADQSLQTNSYSQLFTPHTVEAVKGVTTGSVNANMFSSKDVIVSLDYTDLAPNADAGTSISINEDTSTLLDGSGSSDDIQIVSWSWVDGSGTITLSGETVNYMFANPGVYDFTLTVTDNVGATDTDMVTITVLDVTNPVADAGMDLSANEDTTVSFDSSASYDNVGITNYTWTFMDNGTSQTIWGSSPDYVFAEPGVYDVTLTVTDGAGLTDSNDVSITIIDMTPPVAIDGDGQTVPQGTEVTLDGTASTDNVGITAFEWTFNDGANDVVQNGPVMNHTFMNLGNFTVTLEVWDAAGNSDTLTVWVNVIDVTAPEVLVIAPGEDSEDVPLDWNLIIVFTEAMDTASVEAAFNISGVNVTDFDWDMTDRYVTISFEELGYDTEYNFTVGPEAMDLAGNEMGTAHADSFLTAIDHTPPPPVEPTVDDTDGDGVDDVDDAFPNDPAASIDTDADGMPDVYNPGYDQYDTNLTEDLDDDGDGIIDDIDDDTPIVDDDDDDDDDDVVDDDDDDDTPVDDDDDAEDTGGNDFMWIIIIIIMAVIIVLQAMKNGNKPDAAPPVEEAPEPAPEPEAAPEAPADDPVSE